MSLSLNQIVEYQTNGYLIAGNVLTNDDLQPVIDEINLMIDARARILYKEGKITDLCEDASFERRIALLHQQCPEISHKFDIMHLRGRAMFDFLHNERLLNAVECHLGQELSCNPIQHLRSKMPWKGRDEQAFNPDNVPWHQDAAVTSPDSEASEIITFWLPLVNATAEMGCMEVMPEVFKLGYLKHRDEGGTTIVKELLPHVRPIAAECRKGSIVMMNKYTPHRGTTNRSDIVRWSLDLRFHKTGAASGRSFHPSFVVRSRSNPGSVMTDYDKWCQLWKDALEKPEPQMHRV